MRSGVPKPNILLEFRRPSQQPSSRLLPVTTYAKWRYNPFYWYYLDQKHNCKMVTMFRKWRSHRYYLDQKYNCKMHLDLGAKKNPR